MDIKRASKLPEGVGKKIVEALKKQSVQPEEDNLEVAQVIETTPAQEEESFDYYIQNETVADDESATEQESTEGYEFSCTGNDEDEFGFDEETEEDYEVEAEEETVEEDFTEYEQPRYEEPVAKPGFSGDYSAESLNSANVDILIQLIAQLPTGVTRQTGAQIIRQTMEAMGTSMNRILNEAQQGQDELNEAIKNNMYKIEEFRNNIRILEKDVQISRKKADELEDLISLFILSEKEPKK